MRLSIILIVLFLLTIALLVMYIYYVPPKMVTIVERPVYDYGVSWVPWSMGAGGYGWPGSYYVNRPMPHFYRSGNDGRRKPVPPPVAPPAPPAVPPPPPVPST